MSRHPFTNLASRAIRGLFNPWLLRCTAKRDYDLSDTLVVAGAARSGTTWLAELVSANPRSALIFEPLHPLRVPQAATAGFRWGKNFLEPNQVWPEGEAFLEMALRGKVRNRWTTSLMTMGQAIRHERYIVKLVRANLLLGWIAARFPIRPPALIVRHPCATIASTRQMRWSQPKHTPKALKIRQAYPHLGALFDQLTTPIEFLAAHWCIDHYIPLSLPQPYPFHIVCYERLVRDGKRELIRLFEHWEIPIPDEAMKSIRVHSQSTKVQSRAVQDKDPLDKWRSILSRDEAASILRVVKTFGLDFYTESSEPDYDRLHGLSPIV